MYNRYLDAPSVPGSGAGGGAAAGPAPVSQPAPARRGQNIPQGHSDLLGEVTGGLGEMLGGILKGFSLEKLDTGDILLILIILFLFLEGDNLEIVITLGLMLLLGLGDDEKEGA